MRSANHYVLATINLLHNSHTTTVHESSVRGSVACSVGILNGDQIPSVHSRRDGVYWFWFQSNFALPWYTVLLQGHCS